MNGAKEDEGGLPTPSGQFCNDDPGGGISLHVATPPGNMSEDSVAQRGPEDGGLDCSYDVPVNHPNPGARTLGETRSMDGPVSVPHNDEYPKYNDGERHRLRGGQHEHHGSLSKSQHLRRRLRGGRHLRRRLRGDRLAHQQLHGSQRLRRRLHGGQLIRHWLRGGRYTRHRLRGGQRLRRRLRGGQRIRPRLLSTCIQEAGQELSSTLKNCYKAHHGRSHTIIIFRDEVGDGQLGVSAKHEVEQFEAAFAIGFGEAACVTTLPTRWLGSPRFPSRGIVRGEPSEPLYIRGELPEPLDMNIKQQSRIQILNKITYHIYKYL